MSFTDFLKNMLHFIPNELDSEYGKVIKIINIGGELYNLYNLKRHEEFLKDTFGFFNDFIESILNIPALTPLKTLKLVEIKDDGGDPTYYKEVTIKDVGTYIYKLNGKHELNIENGESKYLFFRDGFNFEKLGEAILKSFNGKFYLSKLAYNPRYGAAKFNFENIVNQDKIFDFKQHKITNDVLKNKGVYLFYGQPGTGKSTFMFSNEFEGKVCIKVLASLFVDLDLDTVKNIFNMFKPDLLIIEEFDKAAASLDSVLLFLERIRNNNINIVLTANDLSGFDLAVLRPQRIDKIIRFDLPSEDNVRELVNHFSKSQDEVEKEKLIKLLIDSNFSHAYVVDFAKKLNNNYDEIEEYISFINGIKKSREEKEHE